MAYHKHNRGSSLIEVLVACSLLLILFGGLFYGYKYALELTIISRSKLTALTLMNSKMEYIQSLTYDNVGTQGGIIPGPIPQTSTTTLNNIEFQERVLVDWVFDPADGVYFPADDIETDYKRVKIEYSWNIAGIPQKMFLVNNVVPRSLETNLGGGTLRVNVFDANVTPLPGAQVRVINNSLVPTIDTTRTSDASGVALFGGAATGSEYQIFVSRAGYSEDQTHLASPTIPKPTTLPVSVLAADVTTMNFFIDQLSAVDVRTFASRISNVDVETFAASSALATSTQVSVSGNELHLLNISGTYAANGTAFLTPLVPTSLVEWQTLKVNGNQPTDTTISWSVYQPTVPPTLIPDSEIPGNSSGHALGQIDISSLSATTYPILQVGFSLTTASSTVTPVVNTVTTSYVESATPRSSQAVTLTSQKSIGTDASSTPISKHVYTEITDSAGEVSFSDIEWDTYAITALSHTIAEACPNVPHIVPPGTTTQLDLVLVTASTHNLRVVVEAGGTVLPGAEVVLSRPSFTEISTTSACGQVFFTGLTAGSDYTLDVSVPDHGSTSIYPFTVDGTTVESVSL